MGENMFGLKCLDADMRSCNGGSLQWQIDKWYNVKGKIKLCKNGIHLTFQPKRWQGSRVFLAETPKVYISETDKFVCRKARLIRELSSLELEAYKKAEAQALEAYEKAEAQALEAYEKAEDQALEAYEKAEAPAWEAYKKAKAPALEAYKKAKAPALEAYKKAKAPAWEAYEKAVQEVLAAYATNP